MAPYIKFLSFLVTMVGFFQGTEGKLYQMNKGCIGNLDLSEKNLQANIDADGGDPSKNQTTVQAAEDWVHKYHWIFTYRQKKDFSEYVNVDESRLTLPQWIEQTNKLKEAVKNFYDPYQSDIPTYFCEYLRVARQCNLPSFEDLKC